MRGCRVTKPQSVKLLERERDGLFLPVDLDRKLPGALLQPGHRGEIGLHETELFHRLGEEHAIPFVNLLFPDPQRPQPELPRLTAKLLGVTVQPRNLRIGRGENEVVLRIRHAPFPPPFDELSFGIVSCGRDGEPARLLVGLERLGRLPTAYLLHGFSRPGLPLADNFRERRLLLGTRPQEQFVEKATGSNCLQLSVVTDQHHPAAGLLGRLERGLTWRYPPWKTRRR